MTTQDLMQALGVMRQRSQQNPNPMSQYVVNPLVDQVVEGGQANLADPNVMMQLVMGMTGEVGGKSTRVLTDVPRKNLLPNKVPYVIGDRPKVYDSIRQAIKAAMMIPHEGTLMPRPVGTTQLQILTERLMQLKKGGFSTKNVEKAIQDELKVAQGTYGK